jgi:hypothetical protein
LKGENSDEMASFRLENGFDSSTPPGSAARPPTGLRDVASRPCFARDVGRSARGIPSPDVDRSVGRGSSDTRARRLSTGAFGQVSRSGVACSRYSVSMRPLGSRFMLTEYREHATRAVPRGRTIGRALTTFVRSIRIRPGVVRPSGDWPRGGPRPCGASARGARPRSPGCPAPHRRPGSRAAPGRTAGSSA